MDLKEDDCRRTFWLGMGILYILIGISILLAIFFDVKNNSINFMLSSMGWFGILIEFVFGLIFLFLIILSISLIFKAFSYSDKYFVKEFWNMWNHDKAIEILRERYAKGEITKEQYEQMLADLEKGTKYK